MVVGTRSSLRNEKGHSGTRCSDPPNAEEIGQLQDEHQTLKDDLKTKHSSEGIVFELN